jgi:prepilin-type N-terminal cleavage/methylation domain-containing protein
MKPISRAGFTMLELVAALLILGAIMALVAQVAQWSMLERGRLSARQAALETATNLLESARAMPWENLTAAWAAAQGLPTEVDALPLGSKLLVRVEADKLSQRTKRVTVQVLVPMYPGQPEATVELVGLYSARSVHAKEGKP